MIPDAATIARRRHMVTITVRAAIVLFAAWVAWGIARSLSDILQPMLSGGGLYIAQGIWNFATSCGPEIVLVGAMFFLEQRIVRWIVPMPRPDTACPTCGYSLKGLKSPICPECGSALRAPGR